MTCSAMGSNPVDFMRNLESSRGKVVDVEERFDKTGFKALAGKVQRRQ